jgi:hypothetical protein
MSYLSDMNLRAVLTVLIERAGGEIYISNEELYDAIMPATGIAERFYVEETGVGVRVWIELADGAQPNGGTQAGSI